MHLRGLEFAEGSHINAPIAVLIWLMIYPMMLKIDFRSIRSVGRRPRGLLVTLFVNWLVKPFSMAFFGWLFFRHLFSPWIGPDLAGQYIAGVIILAAAPCTAMVFVWSYLSDGDPAYTLVQVSVNDLVMLVAFAPIVKVLVTGAAGLEVPFRVLLLSVLVFVVIPLAAGAISRKTLIARYGTALVRRTVRAPICPRDHRSPACHADADLRLSGREHHRALASRSLDRGADPRAGLLQLLADLRPHEVVRQSSMPWPLRARSSERRTSSSLPWQRPSRSTAPARARRWRRSWEFSSKFP